MGIKVGSDADALESARERIVDAVIAAAAVLAAPAWVLSLIASQRADVPLLPWVTTLGYGWILLNRFWRGLGTRVRAATIVALMQLLGLTMLQGIGPIGPGLMWLMAGAVTAAALLPLGGARLALASHLVGVVVMTLIYLWVPSRQYTFPYDGTAWFATAAGSLMLGGTLSEAVGRLVAELSARIARLRQLEAQLEGRVRRRTVQLASANADLERFARAASHDLRTPLQVIGGSAELLGLDPEGLAPKQRAHVERIVSATARARTTISSLMDLAAGEAVRRVDVDLSELARAVLDDLQIAEPSRAVELVIQRAVQAHADEDLVQLALQNLMSNAWKYTSKRTPAVIEFGANDESGERVYFVRDNGAGFDAARGGDIFVEFMRLHGDEEFPGTGLGLATVARVVGRHGGRVWADGAPEQGATVRFTLGEAARG